MPEKETAYEKARQELKDLEDKLAWYSQQEEETAKTIRAIDATIQSINEQLRDGKR
jgi:predicted  nucleic acid-binding Zn-ribbon protein